MEIFYKCDYCPLQSNDSGLISKHQDECRKNPKFARENELLEKKKKLELENKRIDRELNKHSCDKCEYYSRNRFAYDVWTHCSKHDKDDIFYTFGCDEFKLR